MLTVISGSRSIVSYERFCKVMEYHLARHPDWPITAIIEGCAAGVDRSAERWAAERGIPVRHYPARGFKSPLIRNQVMVNLAVNGGGALIAVWDGVSRGTRYTIRYATEGTNPLTRVAVYRLKPDPARHPAT